MKPLGAVEAGIAMHVTVLPDWNAQDGVVHEASQAQPIKMIPKFLKLPPKTKALCEPVAGYGGIEMAGQRGNFHFQLIDLDSMISLWQLYP